MASDALSPAARRFLADHVNSVMVLDLLLLLHRGPEATWTAQTVTGELRCAESWAAVQLSVLHAVGLAAPDPAVEGGFRFAPDAQQARLLDEIVEANRRRRTALIRLIVASMNSDVQAFSDAFRLRKRD